MRNVKKIVIMTSAALAVHALLASVAITRIITSGDPQVPSGSFYGYKNNDTGPGDDAFTKIRDAAVRDHKLLILYFGKDDCSACNSFAQDFINNSVVSGNMLKYGDSYNGHFRGTESNSAKAWLDAKEFLQKVTGRTAVGCHVFVAWGVFEDGVEYFAEAGSINSYNAFSGWKMKQCDTFKAQAKKHLWTPPKSSVAFACGMTEGTRLETTRETENVWIPFVRTNDTEIAETDSLIVKYPNETMKTNLLEWAANQERLELKLADVDTSWVSDGKYTLILCNTNHEAVATNYITCVATPANSASFPYLPGEINIDVGVWSMDVSRIDSSKTNVDGLRNEVAKAQAAYDVAANALAAAVATSNTTYEAYTEKHAALEVAIAAYEAATNALAIALATSNTTYVAYAQQQSALGLAIEAYDVATNALAEAVATSNATYMAYTEKQTALESAIGAYDAATNALAAAVVTSNMTYAVYAEKQSALELATGEYDAATNVLAAAVAMSNTTYVAYAEKQSALELAIGEYDAATNALAASVATSNTTYVVYAEKQSALELAIGEYDAATNALAVALEGYGVDSQEYKDAQNAVLAASIKKSTAEGECSAAMAAYDDAVADVATKQGVVTEKEAAIGPAQSECDTAKGAYDDAVADMTTKQGVAAEKETAMGTAQSECDTAKGAYDDAVADAATKQGVATEKETAMGTAQSERDTAKGVYDDAVADVDAKQGDLTARTNELNTALAALQSAESKCFLVVHGGIVWDDALIALNDGVFSSADFTAWCTNNQVSLVYLDMVEPGTGASLFSYDITSNGNSGASFLSKNGLTAAEGATLAAQAEEAAEKLGVSAAWGQAALPSGATIALVRADGTVAGMFAPQFNEDGSCDLAENMARLGEFLNLLDQPDESANNGFTTWRADLEVPTFEYNVPLTGKLQISNKANVYKLEGAFGGRDIAFTISTNGGQVVNAAWTANTEIWVKDTKNDTYTNLPPYFAMHKDGKGIWQVEKTYNLSQAEIDAGNVFIRVMAWDYEEFASAKLGGNTEFEFVLASMNATPCPGIISFGEQPEEPIIQQTTNQVHRIPLHRLLGKDGEIGITVSIVTNLTTATNKYEFGSAESQEVALHWADGDNETKYVDLTLLGSELKDGLYDIVLKLSETNEVPNETIYNTYSITYGEEPTSQGQLAFETTTMSFQPEGDGRYYVHYNVDKGDIIEDFDVRVIRTGGRGEAVGYATLKDAGKKVLDSATYFWNNYLTGIFTAWIANFPAPGKIGYTDATITLTSSNNFPVASDRATLNIRVISDAAPSFAERTVAQDIVQYVAYEKTVEIKNGLPEGMSVVGMYSISESLPTGLKMSVNKQTGAFTISGTPTKPVDRSKSVWWLKLKDASGGTVYSDPVTIVLTVKSLGGTAADPGSGVIPGFTTARSWNGLPLVDRTAGRLVGILDLTAAKNGRMSARYRKQGNQTISFSSSALAGIEEDQAGVYTAFSQASRTKDGKVYKIEIRYFADDSIAVEVSDPFLPNHTITTSTPNGVAAWSKGNPAKGWAGDYTFALRLKEDVEPDVRTLCAGAAALRLKMTTGSAFSKGAVTFAGTLPNGATVSGVAYLVPADGSASATQLPIFMTSSAETLSSLVDVDANAVTNTAAIFGVEGVTSYWSHVEGKIDTLSYENVYDPMGSRYVYADWMKTRLVTPNKLQSFNRTSGIAAGTVRKPLDPDSEKLTTCTWKGVILPGWGEAGDSVLLGAWWVNQKAKYDTGGGVMKTRSVRVGEEAKYLELVD